jgi:DNA replication protein DnaC
LSAACPDGRCDGSGFLFDEERRRARPCTCRPARQARRRAAAVAGRLPRRFREVSLEREPLLSIERANPHVVREVRQYVRALPQRLDGGRGIWFTGDVGTGKTTLAMLISKAAMEAERTVAIYSLPRLLTMLRETFAEGARRSLSDLLDRLCAVDLLHVDDVGAEQTTDWVLEQLYTIVNTRYEDGRALLLTTNLVGTGADHEHPAAPLVRQIGERTVSRIYEMCGEPLPLFGSDHRMEAEWRLPAGDEPAGGAPWGSPAGGRPEGGRSEGEAAAWDPFDDSTWEEDAPRYGRPRSARSQPLD